MAYTFQATETNAATEVYRNRREIPFNYTSADDHQAMSLLVGAEVIETLEQLRSRRVTGRSARLLMRFFGEILIHRRNPYLFQELLDSAVRRTRMFANAEKALGIIERNVGEEIQVLAVLHACRKLLAEFRAEVREAPVLRRRIKHRLGAVVGRRNVAFDPFALVSHATDATDWRLHLPVAVVTPDREEQVAPLLAAIGRMGLKAVPRGAGTGLTGGAVPLRGGCVMINTEKLDRIRGLSEREFRLESGDTTTMAVIEVEAGVVTEKAMQFARERGLVFATDPTSAWACTIGGNIAENAGGKLAVRWGTCIDNLLTWRMAMPGGLRWTVRRIGHPLRKILPEDTVTFDVEDDAGSPVRRIVLRGDEVRRKGLWKDITNKALGGLPGLQKEGTDGVVTSAEFLLYRDYEAKRTLCLEFFGPDMDEASRVILDISRAFPYPDGGAETLLSLEHFDDEYVRAIDYRVKAVRAATPKAVLLIDVAGHTEEQAVRGAARIREILQRHPNTEVFEAQDAEEACRFWADRKKLGAIARRTNAFKLNEDVVIPLEALAEFARFVEEVNLEEERYAQVRFLERAATIFADAAAGDDAGASAKADAALERCARARRAIASASAGELRSLSALDNFRHQVAELMRGFPATLAALERSYREARDRRIVLATHMHAGDGNVHVNVPVLSNDRPMLDRAGEVVDRVMAKVMQLGGVVSGEHGIGVTKLQYLERHKLEELAAYRAEVDPEGLMNPGKLEDFQALGRIFTPSFNLLELEARILQHGQLEELSRGIAHCIRCGKCKPDCCVFHPGQGLFYHPRNKNLAVGSLIEALLYDAQRDRSTHFELLQWLEEVADHCTICHKCLKPCPVDIDTGAVSVLERKVLADWGYKRTPAVTRLTLDYLDSRSPVFNKAFRTTVLRIGMAGQQVASRLARPFQPAEAMAAPYLMRLLRSPMPLVPGKSLRDVLPACEPDQVLVFEPDDRQVRATVFYFPGCGSERMVSTISMAAIHVLLELGTRVVLPPPFLCCGFPFKVNAKTDRHSRIVLRNTIIFNQIREMFAHLDFDACIVTCGTCREGLTGMEAERLFGSRLADVARYAQERGLHLEGGGDTLYHAPCHDSLEGKAQEVFGRLGGFGTVTAVPSCCSEAGTLSLSRPDIADKMRARKREALAEALPGGAQATTIVTNCPSCVQGLGRNRDLGLVPRHLAVVLAERMSGKGWAARFRARAQKAQAFTF